jgi:uncharacterized membrane protein (UPF0127 family)
MDSIRLTDPRGAVWSVDVPRSARERMRGLMGRRGLPAATGMLFHRCRSVHTVGMRFPLDVVFLDRTFRVVDVRSVSPGRWVVRCAGAAHVLELAAGSGINAGEVLQRP